MAFPAFVLEPQKAFSLAPHHYPGIFYQGMTERSKKIFKNI
jgi:hypothetical protein